MYNYLNIWIIWTQISGFLFKRFIYASDVVLLLLWHCLNQLNVKSLQASGSAIFPRDRRWLSTEPSTNRNWNPVIVFVPRKLWISLGDTKGCHLDMSSSVLEYTQNWKRCTSRLLIPGTFSHIDVAFKRSSSWFNTQCVLLLFWLFSCCCCFHFCLFYLICLYGFFLFLSAMSHTYCKFVSYISGNLG